jgi:hypothetical protein
LQPIRRWPASPINKAAWQSPNKPGVSGGGEENLVAAEEVGSWKWAETQFQKSIVGKHNMSTDKRRGRQIVPAVQIPDDGLGEAMLALPPPHRCYAWARVIHGYTQVDAARASGYSASSQSVLAAAGGRLEHDVRIRAAMRELSFGLLQSEGPKSIRKLVELRDSATDEKVQLKAATEILTRAGLNPINQSHMLVEHRNLSDAEQDRRYLELCKVLGIAESSAQKSLAELNRTAPDAIEGEFEELDAAQDDGSQGLEDLLSPPPLDGTGD